MLVFAWCCILLAQIILGLPTTQKPYDGHKILEILHNNEADFRKLMEMEILYELDFWKLPRHSNDTMHVRVPPKHLKPFLTDLENMDARVSTRVHNLNDLLEEVESESEHHRKTKRSVNSRSGFNLETYHPYSEIQTHMNTLASAGNLPNGVTVTKETIGLSFENNPIELVKVSQTTGSAGNKKAIFIDGGIHAREWIAPASVLYILDTLVYNPGDSAAVTSLLSTYDVYLLPVVNPDGYEYSRTSNRMWRKNRRVDSSGCFGVDLNRNFPYKWNPYAGGSTNPCSDLYSGAGAESEPETQALASFLRLKGDEIAAYLTLHAFGQMWLYPWGYTNDYPVDRADLEAAAGTGVNAIKRYSHKKFQLGSSTNVLYIAAGGSDDFAKGEVNIKYAYTLELRDTGYYGFMLPASQILDACEETFVGIMKFAETMQQIENHSNDGQHRTGGNHGNNGNHGQH